MSNNGTEAALNNIRTDVDNDDSGSAHGGLAKMNYLMNIMNVNDSSIQAKHGIFNTDQTSIQEEEYHRDNSLDMSEQLSKLDL